MGPGTTESETTVYAHGAGLHVGYPWAPGDDSWVRETFTRCARGGRFHADPPARRGSGCVNSAVDRLAVQRAAC
jgi:hypothetical protein